jgi:hypothetical protein
VEKQKDTTRKIARTWFFIGPPYYDGRRGEAHE